MPRDLNARRDSYRSRQLKEQTERYDKLETSVTGLFDEIIAKVFPEKEDDTPDFDKFDWRRAQDLEQVLRQFLEADTASRTNASASRQARHQATPPAQPAQTATATAPATAAAQPAPPATAATPGEAAVQEPGIAEQLGLQHPEDETPDPARVHPVMKAARKVVSGLTK